MKKFIISVLSLTLLSTISFAQGVSSYSYGIDTKPFRFGAFVAPTISWMKSSARTDDGKNYNISNEGFKIGFTYGLIAEYYFQPNYAIVSGLQMNMGGGKMAMDRIDKTAASDMINKASFDYSLNFLEIPLALKLRTDPISNFRFFGQAGFSLGFRVTKMASYDIEYFDNDGNAQSWSVQKDKMGSKGTLKPGFSPINVQMSLGLGVEYPIADKLAAYFGFYFNNGFAPDMTNPQNFELYGVDNTPINVNSSFKDGNVRFNNFALRLGIFF
ncbi:MAG TPA: porin family protein [Edaphocola sp.]|nr:porin family protein [Edaphocola sp.]